MKIDRFFVVDMLKDRKGGEIIAAIIKVGKSLDLQVVVEGVGSEEAYQYLLSKECDIIQGFCFSKPLPNIKLELLLKEKKISPESVN